MANDTDSKRSVEIEVSPKDEKSLSGNQITANDDYDPYLHRNIEDPTSDIQALIHILKGCVGTAILALPQAFHYAGLVSGIIGIVFTGLLTWYTWRILFRSQYILCKRHRVPLLSYAQAMEKALEGGPIFLRRFSFLGIPVINGLLIVQQVGTCCVYSVFVPSHVKQISDHYATEVHMNIYIATLVLPWILLLCIPSLKSLALVVQLANLMALLGIAIIIYYVFKDGLPVPTSEAAFGKLENLPIFFSITLFAINPISITTAVASSMETPQSFGGVITIALIFCTILYSAFGSLGYLKYGEESEGSITLNLKNDEIPAQISKIAYGFSVFITYPLQAFVPVRIIWKRFLSKICIKSPRQIQLLWQFVLRVFFVLLTCTFAALIPHIELFISLIGSISLSMLGLTFPPLLALCTEYDSTSKISNFKIYLKNIPIIIFGILAFGFGTFMSIYNITYRFTI